MINAMHTLENKVFSLFRHGLIVPTTAAAVGIGVGYGVYKLQSAIRDQGKSLRRPEDASQPKLFAGQALTAMNRVMTLCAFSTAMLPLVFLEGMNHSHMLSSGISAAVWAGWGTATVVTGATLADIIHEQVRGESTLGKTLLAKGLSLIDRFGPVFTGAALGLSILSISTLFWLLPNVKPGT